MGLTFAKFFNEVLTEHTMIECAPNIRQRFDSWSKPFEHKGVQLSVKFGENVLEYTTPASYEVRLAAMADDVLTMYITPHEETAVKITQEYPWSKSFTCLRLVFLQA